VFKFYTLQSTDIVEKLIGEKASIKLSAASKLNDPYELKFNKDIDTFGDGHEEQYFKDNTDNTKGDFVWWQKHALEHSGFTWYIQQERRQQ